MYVKPSDIVRQVDDNMLEPTTIEQVNARFVARAAALRIAHPALSAVMVAHYAGTTPQALARHEQTT